MAHLCGLESVTLPDSSVARLLATETRWVYTRDLSRTSPSWKTPMTKTSNDNVTDQQVEHVVALIMENRSIGNIPRDFCLDDPAAFVNFSTAGAKSQETMCIHA